MNRIYWVSSIAILLFSCKKDISQTEELKGISKSRHGKYGQPCRIDSMIGLYGLTAKFYYTSWGDPSLIDVSDNGTGNPDFYFTYDKQHRLVEFQAAYTKDVNYQTLTRYYSKGNKVATDSVFSFGSVDPLYYNSFRIGKYLYDKYDRIIEYSYIGYFNDGGINIEERRDTIRYNYANENPYLDNRNYFAGNRVLMFVNKDYSKSTPAESYNTFGYPTTYSDGQAPLVYCCTFQTKETFYDCSGSEKTQQPTP